VAFRLMFSMAKKEALYIVRGPPLHALPEKQSREQ